jgi:hypothetical protein
VGVAQSSSYVVCLNVFTRHLRSRPSPLRTPSSDTISFVTAMPHLRWYITDFRSLLDKFGQRAAILNPVPLPHFQPLPLDRARAPFSDTDWTFEIKWDGFQSLALLRRRRRAPRLAQPEHFQKASTARLRYFLAEETAPGAGHNGDFVFANLNADLWKPAKPPTGPPQST